MVKSPALFCSMRVPDDRSYVVCRVRNRRTGTGRVDPHMITDGGATYTTKRRKHKAMKK